MQDETRNKKKLLLLLLLLTGGIFVGVFALGQRLVKPKAAAGTPTLSFSATPTSLIAGNPFDLTIKANPNGATFNAFELRFTLDPSKVSLSNPANIGSNITRLFPSSLSLSSSLSGNTLIITGAKTGTAFSGTADVDLVKVAMKTNTGITGSVTFGWDQASEIEGKTPELQEGNFTISQDVPPSITPTITGPPARLYFNSVKTSYTKGENMDLELFLEAGTNQVSSLQFEFIYRYPGTYPFFLDPQESDIILDSSSGFDINNPLNSIDTSAGKAMVGLVAATTPVSGIKKLATVKLVVNPNALYNQFVFEPLISSRVYNPQTQNILGNRDKYTITLSDVIIINPTITPTVTPIPSLTPTPVPACPIFSTSCPATKGKGDADCDGAITECDYTLWKSGFTGSLARNADFNFDSTINLVDYEIWRRGFYGGGPYPTSVPTPTFSIVPSLTYAPTIITSSCPTANKSYVCTTSSNCTKYGVEATQYKCPSADSVCCKFVINYLDSQ